jgi:hypothetical protein
VNPLVMGDMVLSQAAVHIAPKCLAI